MITADRTWNGCRSLNFHALISYRESGRPTFDDKEGCWALFFIVEKFYFIERMCQISRKGFYYTIKVYVYVNKRGSTLPATPLLVGHTIDVTRLHPHKVHQREYVTHPRNSSTCKGYLNIASNPNVKYLVMWNTARKRFYRINSARDFLFLDQFYLQS